MIPGTSLTHGGTLAGKVSTKQLMVDLGTLKTRFLGQLVPFALAGPGAQAKAAAVIACCAAHATSSPSGITVPAFNKLSGIVEFCNAVALYVCGLMPPRGA